MVVGLDLSLGQQLDQQSDPVLDRWWGQTSGHWLDRLWDQ